MPSRISRDGATIIPPMMSIGFSALPRGVSTVSTRSVRLFPSGTLAKSIRQAPGPGGGAVVPVATTGFGLLGSRTQPTTEKLAGETVPWAVKFEGTIGCAPAGIVMMTVVTGGGGGGGGAGGGRGPAARVLEAFCFPVRRAVRGMAALL